MVLCHADRLHYQNTVFVRDSFRSAEKRRRGWDLNFHCSYQLICVTENTVSSRPFTVLSCPIPQAKAITLLLFCSCSFRCRRPTNPPPSHIPAPSHSGSLMTRNSSSSVWVVGISYYVCAGVPFLEDCDRAMDIIVCHYICLIDCVDSRSAGWGKSGESPKKKRVGRFFARFCCD